jgi:alkaline phosphatase
VFKGTSLNAQSKDALIKAGFSDPATWPEALTKKKWVHTSKDNLLIFTTDHADQSMFYSNSDKYQGINSVSFTGLLESVSGDKYSIDPDSYIAKFTFKATVSDGILTISESENDYDAPNGTYSEIK